MNHDEFHRVIDALDDLLEEEKAALLQGNLDGVARLLEAKEKLIDQLAALESGDSQPLRSLNTRVRRNQALLESALTGIRSVADRLATFRRVRSSLDTYDEKGVRQTVDMVAEKSVEKRA